MKKKVLALIMAGTMALSMAVEAAAVNHTIVYIQSSLSCYCFVENK